MNDDLLFLNHSLKILQSSFLFRDIDHQILKSIIKDFKPVKWQKGESIQSNIGMKNLYIILEGRLKITKIDPKTGRSISLFILHVGDIYDIFTLLDGKKHTAFPIAMDDITAIKTPLHKAREIIKEYPQFNKNFLPYLGKRLRELEDFSESLVFDNTVTRLSKLILKHVIPKKDKDDKHYPLELINDLSHEAISELIGSVRSVVSTQIKQLEKEGTIVTKRGYLAVKNLKELMKKCDIFEE